MQLRLFNSALHHLLKQNYAVFSAWRDFLWLHQQVCFTCSSFILVATRRCLVLLRHGGTRSFQTTEACPSSFSVFSILRHRCLYLYNPNDRHIGCGTGSYTQSASRQKRETVYFISRKLHTKETAFSSSELKTLAVIWAVERLHQYLYGRHFEIRTDHSALKEVLAGGRKNLVVPACISR